MSNSNLIQPLDLPKALNEAYIKYNTAVPSSAHVERLFSAGGQLYDKRRVSMCDKKFEMSFLLKYNKFFDDNYTLYIIIYYYYIHIVYYNRIYKY